MGDAIERLILIIRLGPEFSPLFTKVFLRRGGACRERGRARAGVVIFSRIQDTNTFPCTLHCVLWSLLLCLEHAREISRGCRTKVAKVGPPRARVKSAKVPDTPYVYYPPRIENTRWLRENPRDVRTPRVVGGS